MTLAQKAMTDGARWAFISLVPWLGLGALVSLVLSRKLKFEQI
jgi:hypothetical protein